VKLVKHIGGAPKVAADVEGFSKIPETAQTVHWVTRDFQPFREELDRMIDPAVLRQDAAVVF
jgi:hypothetical protein